MIRLDLHDANPEFGVHRNPDEDIQLRVRAAAMDVHINCYRPRPVRLSTYRGPGRFGRAQTPERLNPARKAHPRMSAIDTSSVGRR